MWSTHCKHTQRRLMFYVYKRLEHNWKQDSPPEESGERENASEPRRTLAAPAPVDSNGDSSEVTEPRENKPLSPLWWMRVPECSRSFISVSGKTAGLKQHGCAQEGTWSAALTRIHKYTSLRWGRVSVGLRGVWGAAHKVQLQEVEVAVGIRGSVCVYVGGGGSASLRNTRNFLQKVEQEIFCCWTSVNNPYYHKM